MARRTGESETRIGATVSGVEASGGRSGERCSSGESSADSAARGLAGRCGGGGARIIQSSVAAEGAGVNGHARQVAVYAYDEPCDMRKSHTLSAPVTQEMKRDLFTGHLFIFVSMHRKRASVLYFDGIGLRLLVKRLEKGLDAMWERAQAGANKLTMSERSLFIEGRLLAAKNELTPPLLTLKDLAVFREKSRPVRSACDTSFACDSEAAKGRRRLPRNLGGDRSGFGFDQQVLHHPGVLMRQDVTVVHRLSDVLFEAHSYDDFATPRYPHRVLDRAGWLRNVVDRDDLEGIDMNMKRMTFESSCRGRIIVGRFGRDGERPFLRGAAYDFSVDPLLVVQDAVDREVHAHDRVHALASCRRANRAVKYERSSDDDLVVGDEGVLAGRHR